MTFQPKLDLWQPERMRRTNVAGELSGSAEAIIRYAVRCGWANSVVTGLSSASPCSFAVPVWKLARRQMLSRVIGWVAARCASVFEVSEQWVLLHPWRNPLLEPEKLGWLGREREVDFNAQACL